MRLNSILLCLLMSSLMAASTVAFAQQTAFINGEPLFASPAGTGVLPGPVNHPIVGSVGEDQVAVDNTDDGLVDAIHDIPAEILQGSDFDLDFRLSPSQQVLFTVKSPSGIVPVCNGDAANVLVYFHRLDTPPATTALASAVCLRAPLSIGPLFYDPDPTASVRTAVVVASPFAGGSAQAVLWVDLVNGGFNLDGSTYSANVMPTPGGMQFAADGRAAFVDHGDGTAFRRFTMIDLCRSRVAAVAAGAVSSGSLGSGTAQGWTVDLGGGHVQAEVRLDGVAQPLTRINLDDCSTPPPPTWALDVAIAGTGLGSVSSMPTGINCAPDCQGVFEDNAIVQLNAVADSGSNFEGWGGDCSGPANSVQVTMTADRTCTASFSRPTADLRVTMSASPDPVTAGETLNLALTAANDGPEPASNVSVEMDLPEGTDFTGASPDGLCFGSGTLATCSIGDLAPGSSTPFSVLAAVAPDQRESLQTQAEISGQPVDPDGTDNQAVTVTDVIAVADLSLSKQVEPDPGSAGNLVVYSFNVENAGPSTATGVNLQDSLPDGLSLLTGGQSLGCDTSPIPPNGTSQFRVAVRIDASVAAGTTLTNQASVSAVEADPDPNNNLASASLQVQAGTAPPTGEFVRVVESGAPRPGGGVFSEFLRASQSGAVTAFSHFDLNDPFGGSGHWLALEGAQLRIADGNSPAPGRNVRLQQFRNDDPSMDGISGAFSALLEGGGWGVYRYDGCAIRRLFDDTTVDNIVLPPTFLDQSGESVVFIANNLMRWNGSTVETLVDLSTPLPSGNGDGLFDGVFTLAYDGGPVFFIANGGGGPLGGPPVERGVYAYTNGSITPVATTDTPIPDGTGTFADFDGVGMTLSADGDDVVFRGANAAGERGLYARIDGVLQRIADANTPIPGDTGTFEYLGESFSGTSSFSEPSLSNGRVAFAGKNDDATADNLGLYIWDNGVIEAVVVPGDPAAGGVMENVQLGPRALDGTRLAFTATLIEPDFLFTRAVLLTDLPSEVLFSNSFESVLLP